MNKQHLITEGYFRTLSELVDERFWSVRASDDGKLLIVRAWNDPLTRCSELRLKRFGLDVLVEHDPPSVDLGPHAAFLQKVVEYKRLLAERGQHPASFPPLLVHSEDANKLLSAVFQSPRNDPSGSANFFGVPCVWHRELDAHALR